MRLKNQDKVDHILNMVSLSFIVLMIFSASLLVNTIPVVHADGSSVSTTTVRVAESCSMTSETSVPHEAELHNGLYSDTLYPNGFGSTTIQTFCNDGLGFAIYAVGYTNNEFGNTKLHSDEVGDTHDINTGIYTSGTTTNSTWSMKLSSVAGDFAPTISDGTNNTEDFTSWHVIPEEYTRVAYKTTGTDILVNNEGTGSSLTLTYDTYISTTQPAGTYIGQVKYTLVHPNTHATPVQPLKPTDCPANSICYAPNADDVQGDMSSLGTTTALTAASSTAGMQTKAIGSDGSSADITSGTTEVELIAPNFYREGYGFAGWSTDFTATSTSTIYGPNETISTNPTNDGLDVSSGAILYPVWVASTGNLHGWDGCNSLTTAPTNTRATLSSITALTDTRDGNVYTIARLADGKCWMIENLRLDNTATISTSDTHNPLHDVNNNVTLKIDYANNTVANHLAATNDSWCTSGDVSCYDQTMLNTNNTNFGGKNTSNTDLTPTYNGGSTTSQWHSYGNYYNWYSATAGNGTYSFSTNNDSVTGDLCPTGWRLPQGGQAYAEGNISGVNVTGDPSTYRDFYNLGYILVGTTAYENTPNGGGSYYSGANYSNLFRTFPNNFVYSGYWYGAQAGSRSSVGYYWSSSASNNSNAYDLLLRSYTVGPGTNRINKNFGFMVRCVAGS